MIAGNTTIPVYTHVSKQNSMKQWEPRNPLLSTPVVDTDLDEKRSEGFARNKRRKAKTSQEKTSRKSRPHPQTHYHKYMHAIFTYGGSEGSK